MQFIYILNGLYLALYINICDFLKHLCKSVHNDCLIYVILQFSQNAKFLHIWVPIMKHLYNIYFFIIVSFCLSNVVASISCKKTIR